MPGLTGFGAGVGGGALTSPHTAPAGPAPGSMFEIDPLRWQVARSGWLGARLGARAVGAPQPPCAHARCDTVSVGDIQTARHSHPARTHGVTLCQWGTFKQHATATLRARTV